MKNIYFYIILSLIVLPSISYSKNSEPEEYLIITRPLFVGSIEGLINLKQSQGLIVNTILLEDIIITSEGRDVQEKIRNYILEEYENNNLKWVLIIGAPDADDNVDLNNNTPTVIDKEWEIPMRYIYCPSWDSPNAPTDIYYSCLDGNWDYDGDDIFGESIIDCSFSIDEADWISEITIGRVPARSTSQVENYINKLIEYNYSNIGENDIFNLQINGKIVNAEDNIKGKVLASVEGCEPATIDNINSSIDSSKYKCITYTGDANQIGILVDDGLWTGAGIQGEPFFMYVAACLSAEIDHDNNSNSFAQNLLFQESSGALAYIGANSLSPPGFQLELWDEFWRVYYDDNETFVGNALDKAKFNCLSYNSLFWSYYQLRYVNLIYNLYGDPNFRLGIIFPNGPRINSLPSLQTNDKTYYSYDYDNQATAIGEGNIHWDKVDGPEYFKIFEDGLIQWIPDLGVEIGNQGRPLITIKASDDNGSTLQKFAVSIWDPINPPRCVKIASKPNVVAILDQEYFYNETKRPYTIYQESENWQLIKGPKGFSINSLTGEINWTPQKIGNYEIIIAAHKICDGFYGNKFNSSDLQKYYITVDSIPNSDFLSTNFFAEYNFGVKPFKVKFHEKCLGEVNQWRWNFGDNQYSSLQNPQHTYLIADTFNVKLTIYRENSIDSLVRENYIIILPEPPPVANFTATNRFGLIPSTVEFTNLTSNTSNSWYWDFGDSTFSFMENPSHVYTEPGSYSVTLKSIGPYGQSSKTRHYYINAYENYNDTIISHWIADSVSDIFIDVKNGHNGMIYGASADEKCNITRLNFDGIDDYVEVNNHIDFSPHFITIEAIIYMHQDCMYESGGIIEKWEYGGGGNKFYSLSIQYGQIFFCVVNDPSSPGAWRYIQSNEKIPFNQWVHIAGVFDGDLLKIFLNHSLVGSMELDGRISGGDYPLSIGTSSPWYTANKFIKGSISEIRISRYPLDPQEFLSMNPYIFNTFEDITICSGDNYNGWTSEGIYQRSLVTIDGCDSIVTTNLSLFPSFLPEILKNGDTLRSANIYSSYQWYNQFGPIPGATLRNFIVKENGNYFLIVIDENGCSNTSDVVYAALAVPKFENSYGLRVSLFPNPTNGFFTLEIDTEILVNINIELFNSYGQSLEVRSLKSVGKDHIEKFNTTKLRKGIYYLKIYCNGFLLTKKIIVL